MHGPDERTRIQDTPPSTPFAGAAGAAEAAGVALPLHGTAPSALRMPCDIADDALAVTTTGCGAVAVAMI
ncbi:hypothetical protein [Xanthomonas vesicatoria]|uniref:hypothetical protein n=1 Tax=Xanthomonas vesicatoria TaxID=56460 RepID=UPI001E61E5A9|nr:hypothetical protein [Xanthomonas vesicatoria]MCC8617641.1 hypothetical protein [Xanthomonas vesicatoria]MCC8629666.1 hypothetical protein [Xanthomonas vesicatoria]